MGSVDTLQVKIGAALINVSKCEKLLAVKIDNKLTIDKQITSVYKKVSTKLIALSRVSQYMCPEKRHLIMNAIFSAVQLLFSYMDVSY